MISLNDEKIEFEESLSVIFLLERQGFQGDKIALAINGSFVPRSQYAETNINDGDEVDVIQAVGGG
ncbi:MAG: sulfur carrier protein [Candidatus Endobugula sp.]|jgi:sulfur carrier protein